MVHQVDRRQMVADFLLDVWSDGKVDLCQNYIAASYKIHHDPGDPWDGQTLDVAAFKERVRQSRKPFPDQRFHVQEVLADGEAVAVTWLWSATHLEDLPGFRASGRAVTMSGATVYYFDEQNKISGHWQIVDRLGVYQQLRASS